MIALLRKNLTCYISKLNSSSVCRSRVSFSFSVHFFSTSRGREIVTSPTVYDILLHKHQFSPEVASRVAAKLTHLKTPKKADSVLSFLKESGFSTSQLEKIVNYRPRFLSASVEVSIKPKIKIFQELGFSSDDIAKIITNSPAILHLSANDNIIPSLSVLKGLLGSNSNVLRLLRVSARVIPSNLEKTMVPNVEFLKCFGIPMERILALLYHYPRALLLNPKILRRSVDKVEEMGVNRSSNLYIYAIRIIASRSNKTWEIKLQAFRDLGFSESDILTMFRMAPMVFSLSMEKIKNVKDILLATGKFDMSCIVKQPRSLSCSIEKRYKPRLRILGILESSNLIKNWPGLGKLCTLTDDQFFKKFIGPYLNEAGQVYITKGVVSGQKGYKTLSIYLNHWDEVLATSK